MCKGLCAEKWIDTVVNLHKARWRRAANASRTGKVYVSFDNAQWHNEAAFYAAVRKMGLAGRVERLPLPPGSPDLHKVVEHTIGLLKRNLTDEVMNDARLRTVEQFQLAAERVFRRISTAGIQKDIDSLPLTYQAVIDAEGGWPPKKAR